MRAFAGILLAPVTSIITKDEGLYNKYQYRCS
jgi:hypothetical protein